MQMIRPIGGLLLVVLTATPTESRSAEGGPGYLLQSARKPGQIDRVKVVLEVGGDVLTAAEGEVNRDKMSVVCNLQYDEKTLDGPAGHPEASRSVRYYDTAEAVVKVGRDGFKPMLRSDRRLIVARLDSQNVLLFCPTGPLTRDELELVDVLGNSLLFDRFLPEGRTGVGDSWKPSTDLLAAFLGLDAVAESTVESVLTEVTQDLARIEMAGRLEGAVHGVSSEIQLKAKYRFDRRRQRIDWFGLWIQEQRNSSPVADGVDATALVRVQVTPKAESSHLSQAALAGLPLEPAEGLRRLAYESPGGAWQLTYDRCWYLTTEHRDLSVLRMLVRGELVAQCNLSPLAKLPAGRFPSIAQFQADVQRALGESFGQLVNAGESAGEAGYRVYKVVVRGEVSELPIQWRYYLVGDEQGRRAALVFTVEERLADRLADADRELVDSLRFGDPKMAMNSEDP